LRNIKDGDVLIAPRKKIIDEGRLAPATRPSEEDVPPHRG
jgi:hypothetical protein